jgi:hypothetical protein
MGGRKHRMYDQTILVLKQSHLSLSYPILTLTLHILSPPFRPNLSLVANPNNALCSIKSTPHPC